MGLVAESMLMQEAASPDLQKLLQRFGKTALRPGQGRLISLALAGRPVLGLLPTGYGKSLCYQAAAELMGGTSVVVSPLLALMREQVEGLQRVGIAARRFDSTLAEEERAALLHELAAGQVRLLYVAPESLENARLNDALAQVQRALFIVDEAHCISEWGHSFRPDYLRLPAWLREHSFAGVMALTATATPRVRADLCAAFGISPEGVVAVSPYRANISRFVRSAPDPEAALLEYVAAPEHRPCIIYARTRKGVEKLAAHLVQGGVRAVCYHAGQPAELREKLQDDFLHNRVEVLVATIAFGMGIDKPDVRSVVHANLPSSPESYLQESGRAGRDGLSAESVVLLSGEDRVEARNRIFAAEPDAEGVLRCVRWLLPAAPRVVSLWELGTACDVPEDVPQRALDLLRARGAVRAELQGYKYYKVRPLFPLDTILDGRDAAESARLRWLSEHREAEVEEAAEAWDCSYAEALEQLAECEAAGEWKLTLRQRAWWLCPGAAPAEAREVAAELTAAYSRRCAEGLARQVEVEAMLCGSECLNTALERYFTGENLPAPCGHCPACLGQVAELPPLPAAQQLPPAAELPEFDRPAQRRRFLAGISSPALMARRLWAHPHYGAAAHTLWEEL